VKPDTYTVRASPFTQGGYTYVPDVQLGSVTVTAGQTAGSTVTYVPRVAQVGVGADVTAPVLTLDTDTGLNRLSGTASDDMGAADVEAFVGTTSLGHAAPDSTGHWTLAWPTRQGSAYEVTVIATDASGNTTRLTRNLGLE
jgi:Bacterial Ig domain